MQLLVLVVAWWFFGWEAVVAVFVIAGLAAFSRGVRYGR